LPSEKRKKMQKLLLLQHQHLLDLLVQALQVLLPMDPNPIKKSLLPRQKPRQDYLRYTK
jgi:hypothetical protein